MNQNFTTQPQEGDLHAVVETFGCTFELRYGYYENCDRDGPPDVIYPNFKEKPQYTAEGQPFVTRMQDACSHFTSNKRKCPDSSCGDCSYFRRGEDWFGICRCPHNRKNE